MDRGQQGGDRHRLLHVQPGLVHGVERDRDRGLLPDLERGSTSMRASSWAKSVRSTPQPRKNRSTAFLARTKRGIASKYHATREVLMYLDRGEPGLRERREVVKRVAEFDEFSSSYSDKRLAAQSAVAAVAQLVNRKDAFTRMDLLREEEQRKHWEAAEAAIQVRNAKRKALEQIRDDLFRLFGEKNPHRRGMTVEGVLNRLFEASGILVREAFVVSSESTGVIEEIDGAVELDGRLYLMEMKWWDRPLGRAEVANHLVSVRGFPRGQDQRGDAEEVAADLSPTKRMRGYGRGDSTIGLIPPFFRTALLLGRARRWRDSLGCLGLPVLRCHAGRRYGHWADTS